MGFYLVDNYLEAFWLIIWNGIVLNRIYNVINPEYFWPLVHVQINCFVQILSAQLPKPEGGISALTFNITARCDQNENDSPILFSPRSKAFG